ALRVQEIALHEGRDLEVLRLAQRRHLGEMRRQPLEHALGRLRFACRPRQELWVQQLEAARRVRKTKTGAVKGIVDGEQAAAVEGGQKAARPAHVDGQ